MNVLDVNLLLYSYDPDSPLHSKARPWLERQLSGRESVGIPLLAITAFLRIATHAYLPHLAAMLPDALDAMDALIAAPRVVVLHTDATHWRTLRRVLEDSGVTGRTVTDAQFAAFAIQYGGTLFSTDRHFARFPRLRWENPLDNE